MLGEGMLQAGLGLAVGAMALLAVSRFVRSQLFGLEPTDPVTFASAAGLLLVSMIACAVPARRAATVDAMVALREE